MKRRFKQKMLQSQKYVLSPHELFRSLHNIHEPLNIYGYFEGTSRMTYLTDPELDSN